MEVPEVTYAKDEERIAIEGPDEEIYPRLVGQTQAEFKEKGKAGTGMGSIFTVSPYKPPGPGTYDERPDTVPFNRDDLLAFQVQGLEKFTTGNWSIYWNSNKKKQTHDIVYSKEWRSVMLFRTIELMIRPLYDFRGRADGVEEPPRLYLAHDDVQKCLQKALQAIDDRGMGDGPLLTLMGTGHVQHPVIHRFFERIPIDFEWMIDRALQDKVDKRVREWKYEQFKDQGGAYGYHKKKQQYDTKVKTEAFNQSFLQQRERSGGLFRTYVEPTQPEPHKAGSSRRGKRSSMEMSASQELSPSSKRRSVGSQSSYGSRSNAPRSLTTSPEMGRGTPVSGSEWQAMPRDVGWGRRSVGSQSSFSSRSELAPQSLTASPEMGRQTPVTGPETPPVPGVVGWGPQTMPRDTSWENQMMPPPPDPTYRHTGTAYGYTGYRQYPPAASPRLAHPPTPAAPAQYGSASTNYWDPPAPAQSSYASYTGNYPSAAAGMAPPMPPFPGTTGGSWGGRTYPANPPTSSAATNPSGVDVFSFLDPSSVPAAGRGNNASQYQDTSVGMQPGWWDEAGNYIRSNQPYHGNQSGYQGQYEGGSGSGQR